MLPQDTDEHRGHNEPKPTQEPKLDRANNFKYTPRDAKMIHYVCNEHAADERGGCIDRHLPLSSLHVLRRYARKAHPQTAKNARMVPHVSDDKGDDSGKKNGQKRDFVHARIVTRATVASRLTCAYAENCYTSRMATPRKEPEREAVPTHLVQSADELKSLDYQENEAPDLREVATAAQKPDEQDEADKEFGGNFLRDFPHFTAHQGDMRAMYAARRLCKLWRYEDLNIFVLIGEGKDRDISAERVLGKDDENNVSFYGTKRSVVRALNTRGHEAHKTNLEQHYVGERAEVFVMLDPEVRVTPKLLRHIEPRGFVWSDIKTANALRAHGSYRFIGAGRQDGGLAFGSRENDPTFWKNAEVDSDASFEIASGEGGEGVVTYTEAARKVNEAHDAGVAGMTDDIFKSYKKLIEWAEKQNSELVARGETELPLTLMVSKKGNEKEWSTTINTLLPTKVGEHEDKMIVMRKGPM